jgi:hypothetical protein
MPQTAFAPSTPVLPPYAPDMPVAELRTAEAFLVTTLRLWAGEKASGAKTPRDWRSGFLAAGLEEDAAPDFDMALRILHAGAQPPLALRDFRHPRLAADEARLLSVFGHLQRGDVGAALTELQYRLPTKSLRWMLRYARSAAGALAVRGLILPDRSLPGVGITHRASPAAFVDRGAALLH